MEEKRINNAFYIECMTSLRYAVPFIKKIKELLGLEIPLLFERKNIEKYNSIFHHTKKLESISKENEINIIEITNVNLSVERIFTIENTSSRFIKYEKMFSFQHGFDWKNLAKKNKDSTYLVTEEWFKSQINELGLKCIVQPSPVVFWDWSFFVKKCNLDLEKKRAVIFYPQQGNKEKFFLIYHHLKNLGFEVCVKQRRKHQNIPEDLENKYYDNIWYPSESIFLPIASDVIVGFETSAYTDLVHLNRAFIDFAISEESRSFYKPNKKNFFLMQEDFQNAFDNFCKMNFENLGFTKKIENPCSDEEIFFFLKEIFEL